MVRRYREEVQKWIYSGGEWQVAGSPTLGRGQGEQNEANQQSLSQTLSYRARERGADQGAQVGSGVQAGRSVAQAWWRDIPR